MTAPAGGHDRRQEPLPVAETCLYLYAVTRGGAAVDVGAGMDGRSSVRSVAWGELEAHGSFVLVDEFGAEALRHRAQDPQELEELARRHQRVVEQIHRARTALPFKLGTLCADERAAAQLLEQNHGPLLEELTRLDGCDEWGVKLFADRRQVEAALVETAPLPGSDGSEAVGAGRAFLMRKRAASELAARTGAFLSALSTQASEELASLAEEVRREDLTVAGLGAHQPGAELILSAAFLVPRRRSEGFLDGVRRFAASKPGLRAFVSGPWAPYSFVRVVEGGPP